MDPKVSATRAGGCLLAFSVLAGVVIGTIYHQQSIGFLGGLVVGLTLLTLVWLLDRRSRR